MGAPPDDLLALGLLVFALGLKHGCDVDHLATIDGLTRFNSRANPRLARFCGTLFSLGHGSVVIVIALAASAFAQRWQTPAWLELFGAWVSIAFLAGLGLLNIIAVLRTKPAQVVRPVGLRARFLQGLTKAASPGLIALVGALFALSFDTISQAALIALSAAPFGGWRTALMLGIVFLLGMLLMDGLNGVWISRLIHRADLIALVASRVMSLVVGGMSLVVAAFTLAKLLLPSVAAWSAGMGIAFGGVTILVIAGSFYVSVWLTRATRPAAMAGRD